MHLDPLKFDSSRSAALAQIQKIQADEYARTRNYLNGKVTRMSPWLTHGWTDTLEVAHLVNMSQPLSFDHKLIFELGWREFFKHAHLHLGDSILDSIKDPVYPGKYSKCLPDDFVEARTGVKPVDESTKELYETGYIHNHARMWIASYLVHIRKTDWRAGADWMYSHLVDGDLASNHLSWQWVAGTFSHKPYLFNADNVEKFAPQWACRATAIDTSYDRLQEIATQFKDVGPEKAGRAIPTNQPKVMGVPLDELPRTTIDIRQSNPGEINELNRDGSDWLLIHPWNLGELHSTNSSLKIGVLDVQFHERFVWSKRRWKFVLDGLSLCDHLLVLDSTNAKHFSDFLFSTGLKVETTETLNPGYSFITALPGIKTLSPKTILPLMTDKFHSSFSKFYKTGVKKTGEFQKAMEEASHKLER